MRRRVGESEKVGVFNPRLSDSPDLPGLVS